MTESRPHLVAVEGAATRPTAVAPRPGRRLSGLLAVLALLCALGWGLTRRQVGQLEAEVAASQQALGEARATLAALLAQRGEVRAQLEALSTEAAGLAGRLGELEALVAADPVRAADAQAMRNPDSPQN